MLIPPFLFSWRYATITTHSSSSLEFMSNGWLMVLFWHIFQSFSQIVLLCKKEDWTQPGGNCFGMQRQALLSLSQWSFTPPKFRSCDWWNELIKWFKICYIFRILKTIHGFFRFHNINKFWSIFHQAQTSDSWRVHSQLEGAKWNVVTNKIPSLSTHFYLSPRQVNFYEQFFKGVICLIIIF